MARATRLLLHGGLLFVPAAMFVFGLHLGGEFFWDDAAYLRDNPRLAPGAPFLDAVRLPITGQAFRPLSTATLWAQSQLEGFVVAHLRAVDVAVHVVCAWLVLAWLRRALADAGWLPLAGAAVFLLHPAATEAVMFLSARHDLLGAAFALAPLALQGRGGPPRRFEGPLLYATSLCAALCKETYVVLPLLLWLSRLGAPGDAEAAARAGTAAVRAGLWSAAGAATMLGLRALCGVSAESGLAASLPTLLRSYAALVVHHGATFVTFTDAPTVQRFVPASPSVTASVFVLLAVSFAVLHVRRASAEARLATVGLAVFALSLVPPVAAVPTTGQYGNRYGYLALAGFAALFAAGLSALAAAVEQRSLRRWVAAPVFALAVLIGTRTSARAAEWRDGITLFGADIARIPDDSRAAYHYGVEVAAREGCEAALPYFERATASEPSYARAQRNVAACLMRLHRHADAVAPAERALRLEPHEAAHRRNLAGALAGAGRVEEARAVLDGKAR